MYHCTQVVVLRLDIDQLLGFSQQSNKVRCHNPTLAKCGDEAQHLEKVGELESFGTPECSELDIKGKNTSH